MTRKMALTEHAHTWGNAPRIVKQPIKSIARSVMWGMIRCGRRVIPERHVVVVCPPVPEENMGDQAMTVAAVEQLRAIGMGPVCLAATGPHLPLKSHWQEPPQICNVAEFFCCQEAFLSELAVMRLLSRTGSAVVIGADLLDEQYGATRTHTTLHAAAVAAKLGLSVNVCGFSLSRELPDSLATQFRAVPKSVRLVPRDPVSLRRLRTA